MDKYFHPILYYGWNYLSMLRLIHVSKRGPLISMPRSEVCKANFITVAVTWLKCTVPCRVVFSVKTIPHLADDAASTYWGWDKFSPFRRRHFHMHFFLMKMYKFRLTFHWSSLLRVQLTIIQHCFRWWLGAEVATSHYLNQWWPLYPMNICVTRTHLPLVPHICVSESG